MVNNDRSPKTKKHIKDQMNFEWWARKKETKIGNNHKQIHQRIAWPRCVDSSICMLYTSIQYKRQIIIM